MGPGGALARTRILLGPGRRAADGGDEGTENVVDSAGERVEFPAPSPPDGLGWGSGAPVELDDPAGSRDLIAAGEAPVGWTPLSWDEVVRTHGDRVFRLAYRLTGNQQDAEDLTQDVFIRVFRSLDSYTPGTFEGWLHRITTNLFLDLVRRRSRVRFEALPEDPERLVGRERSPEAVFSDRHFDGDVEAALAALPEEFRVPVVLCDIEQLTYEEIGATLGVKLGTVRSRIHRGRALLRRALAERAPRGAT